jgi:hypothetical protein
MPKTKQGTEPKLENTLPAFLAHPVRVKCYVAYTRRVTGPKEIADATGEKLRQVAYHTEQLKKFGVIELVRTEQVRGATAHYYRAVKKPYASAEAMEEMSDEQRDALTLFTLQLAFAEVVAALDAGTFDSRPDRWLMLNPLLVDGEGFEELGTLHAAMQDGVMEIEAKSAARLVDDPDSKPIPVSNLALFHERPAA